MIVEVKLKIVRKYFTLVELLATMAILSILVLVAFQFFSTAQNTWSITEAKRSTFEDARIALDIISRDIECAYYGNGTAPFWHWNGGRPSGWGEYRNELIAFVSNTPIPPNSACASVLCEVKYQLYYATSHSDTNDGWVRRSVTGSKNSDGTDNPKWNYLNNFTVGYTTNAGNPVSAFTANSNSSEDYQKLIPYVLDLSFTCDTDTDTGTVINPDTTTSTAADSYDVRVNQPYFPTVVTVSLTVMDRESWQKWIKLQGSNVYHGDFDEPLNSPSRNFRTSHQITFTKMVYLGNRGQN